MPTILLHELGHCAALRFFGAGIHAVRLDVTGFCLEATPPSSRTEEAVTAAAGPAFGLAWILPALRIGGAWGIKSAAAAAVLNTFNLLPAQPLDGGRILCALTEDHRIVRVSSLITSAVLLCMAFRYSKRLLLIPAALILRQLFIP